MVIKSGGRVESLIRAYCRSHFAHYPWFRKCKRAFLPFYLRYVQSRLDKPVFYTHAHPIPLRGVKFALLHIDDYITSTNAQPHLSSYHQLSNITVLGKSRLLLDTERYRVITDMATADTLYATMEDYVFHDELAEHISYHPGKHTLYFNTIAVHSAISLRGKWISLLHHGSENWMHWISEILPQLFADEIELDRDIGIIIDAELPQNMYDTVAKLFPSNTIVQAERHATLNVEHLLVPKNRGYCLMWEREGIHLNGSWKYDKAALLRMRHALVADIVPSPATQLVYSQRKAFFRRIINEKAMHAMLTDLGFTTINPAAMRVQEQITAFHNTRVLLTQAGAALANILFMQKGSTALMLAIDPHYVHYPYFEQYAEICGITLIHVPCKSVQPLAPDTHYTLFSVHHATNADLICDIEKLRQLVLSLDTSAGQHAQEQHYG